MLWCSWTNLVQRKRAAPSAFNWSVRTSQKRSSGNSPSPNTNRFIPWPRLAPTSTRWFPATNLLRIGTSISRSGTLLNQPRPPFTVQSPVRGQPSQRRRLLHRMRLMNLRLIHSPRPSVLFAPPPWLNACSMRWDFVTPCPSAMLGSPSPAALRRPTRKKRVRRSRVLAACRCP